jgi:L-fuconolactonase
MRVDSHVHFWHFDEQEYDWISDGMEVLQQDYLPKHVVRTLNRNGLDGCVAVQARQLEVETHFLVELAKTNEIIKGVVGWIDLRDEKLEDRLQYFSQYPVIKGYRHVVQGEPDDFLLRKEFHRGIKALQPFGYTYDILIYHHQLKPALEFVSLFPEQKFVIDHCAKPDLRDKNIDGWKTHIKEIAKHPNVYCKISGLLTETRWKQWSPADFYPYLDVVFEAFGTDRILYGSDWPVVLLSGIYVQWRSLIDKYMEKLESEEKEKVMGGNAVAFYNLNE